MADETQHSADLNVDEAAARIASLASVEDVDDFVSDEEARKGVTDAAERRKSELGQPSTSGGGTATIRTAYPIDVFEHGIDGVDPITREGVEVSRAHVSKLLDLAEENDVILEEVTD